MKFKLIFLLSLLILPMVYAEIEDMGTVKLDDCIVLYNHCPTCNYINFTALEYPNGTVDTSFNLAMDKNLYDYTYSFCNTSQVGEYFYTTCGDKGGVQPACESLRFFVTVTGQQLDSATTYIYITLLAIMVLFFFLTLGLIYKLPSENSQDDDTRVIKISHLKHLRTTFMGVAWLFIWGILYVSASLSQAYAHGNFIGNLMMSLSLVVGWTGVIFVPLLVLKIIEDVMQDKKLRNMVERGIDFD